jgi:hypothetical protein
MGVIGLLTGERFGGGLFVLLWVLGCGLTSVVRPEEVFRDYSDHPRPPEEHVARRLFKLFQA